MITERDLVLAGISTSTSGTLARLDCKIDTLRDLARSQEAEGNPRLAHVVEMAARWLEHCRAANLNGLPEGEVVA